MPAFQVVPAGGSAVDQCDARGPHLLVFGPDDSADGLKSLAPMIFTGSPVVSDYGQFGSLVFDSVARLSMAGAPAKTLASHRCSDTAVHRIWATALQILARREPSERFFFFTGQRGQFISRLRGLRAHASPTELADFEITDADLEPISGDNSVPPRCAIVNSFVVAFPGRRAHHSHGQDAIPIWTSPVATSHILVAPHS